MKYTFTAILTATVMFAAVFAFTPVDDAQAVHTTVQGTQMTQAIITATANMGALTSDEIVCDSDADFTVYIAAGGPAAANTPLTISDGTVTVTISGDEYATGAGAGSFGADGYSGIISADGAVTITVTINGADDAIISMITTSGATAACVA